VRDYCRAVELWAQGADLAALDDQSVRAACRALRAAWIDRLSRKTLHRWLVAVRGFLRFLGHSDLADLVVLPSGYHAGALPPFLAKEEAGRLLDAPLQGLCPSVWALRDAVLLELLYSVGLSLGEAVALDVGDVVLDSGDLIVRVCGGRAREAPGGGPARAALSLYLPRRATLRRRRAAGDALLISVHGRRLTESGAGKRVRAWAEVAGVVGTARGLRNSYGAHLLDGGCDPRSVQALMGLRRITSTLPLQRCSIGYLEREHQAHHPRRQVQPKEPDRAQELAEELAVMRGEVARLRAELAARVS
jgi:integrase/recombinase XerD